MIPREFFMENYKLYIMCYTKMPNYKLGLKFQIINYYCQKKKKDKKRGDKTLT